HKQRRDGLMHKDDLDGSAALTVKRERTGETFADRTIEVGVRQHDGRVLGIESQDRLKPVRLGVEFLQVVSTLVRSDKGEHIQFPGFHESADSLTAASVNNIDNARRKAVAKCFEQRPD